MRNHPRTIGEFMAPVPPKGINLNVPMSEVFKHVVAKPTDSGDPNDYK